MSSIRRSVLIPLVFIVCLPCLLAIKAPCQVFHVTSCYLDLMPAQSQSQFGKDSNGKPCALLRISTQIDGVVFAAPLGITGQPEKQPGEVRLWLSAGETRIRFTREGFSNGEFTFSRPLESGATYLLSLVESRVEAEAKQTGNLSPATSTTAPAGALAVTATTSSVMAVSGGSETPAATAPGQRPGDLYVNSTPPGADVWVDSILQPTKTPDLYGKFPPGVHLVRVRKAGFDEVAREVTIQPGKTSEIETVLPVPAQVTIHSIPPEARLAVDGRIQGSTPVKLPLPRGQHGIKLSVPGYYVLDESIIVTDTTRTILLRLYPEVNFDLVTVEGGTFEMGSNDGQEEEKPVHTVSVSTFMITRYEVTQKQWTDVMGSNPSHFGDCPQCPVENVSWNDVSQFLATLHARSGKIYRLPTEAEWEFACRGGLKSQGTLYSGSSDDSDVAWLATNAGSKTHPVGEKKPNELGLYDMSGNACEWCSDLFDETYYAHSPAIDPPGSATGRYRILRGGGWMSGPASCRVSSRHWEPPMQINDNNGFRLILDE